MDNLLSVAAAGMRSRMESLDILANNLANAGTSGYKADREFHGVYTAAEQAISPASTRMPNIEGSWIDFQQGGLRNTGNPLDVALDGQGFIAVDGPNGALYTRNGSLSVDSKGTLLGDAGYPVRRSGGGQFKLDPGKPITINKDGTLLQNGVSQGKIEIAGFASPQGLQKQGQSYLRSADESITPDFSVTVTVHQGKLENSNVGEAESAVRLVSLLRQFEMLQKAVTISGEMGRKAAEEVAKVGS
jgi:flagellar basal-body rod protein FlgG